MPLPTTLPLHSLSTSPPLSNFRACSSLSLPRPYSLPKPRSSLSFPYSLPSASRSILQRQIYGKYLMHRESGSIEGFRLSVFSEVEGGVPAEEERGRREQESDRLKGRGRGRWRRVVTASPFVVIATFAAAAFLRRPRGVVGRFQGSDMSASAAMAESFSTSKCIDSHLHIWASPEEATAFPYFPGQEPTLLGSAEFLLQNMEEAGVDGALIVQPINHKFDHSYVTSFLRKLPDRFVGCCLADPTEGGGGVQELERLVKEEGFRAVRFNPYLWPTGENMTNAVGKAMFAKAGELGIPVGFMCFKGLLLHIAEIEALCEEFPNTKVLMDHFGFCRPPTNHEEEEAWNRLLGLARFPQVYVKTSAFFRISREGFPYRDTWPLARQLADAYGAERVMWGSDFPFIMEQCGYEKAMRALPGLQSMESLFDERERGLIMGGTAMALFPGAWGSA